MAKTNKTISTNRSDDHMGRERQLRIDSRDQMERHTNKKVREPKGLPPQTLEDPALEPASPDELGPRILEEKGDEELVSGADLIVGLRAYDGTEDGLPSGRSVQADEFCAVHRRVRSERDHFRELNGQMVRVGEESIRYDKSGDRKDLTRKVPGVLKSIMVRLMPHEAIAIEGVEMSRETLAAAMDATVAEYERATGCEVVTAAAHRMSRTDCHVHIQYTMVQAVTESKHMLGRLLKPWKQLASKLARESLAEEGNLHPAPRAINARKRQLIADGKLTPPPEAGIEFRKFPGLRDLGDGAILGYSFRQKLNLVRAAEAGGEKELAEQVTRRNDERFGRFAPIASRDDADLDKKYLDLWLEKEWRRNVTSRLPDDIQARLVSDGASAARDYAAFGTTIVEEEHIRRRAKELEAKERDLLRKSEALKEDALKAKAHDEQTKLEIANAQKSADEAREEHIRRRATELEAKEKDLLKKTEALKEDALKAKAREEQTKLEIAKAQKSVEEANARAELLSVETDQLRDKANLFDQVVSLLTEVLELPSVGLIARKMTTLWKKLEKIAPHIGLVNKLAAIAAVRSVKPSKPDPDQGKPGNRG